MKTTDRYATAGDENEYEPGSNGTVLKNLCGITTIAGMEQAETLALVQSTEEMLDQHHRFTAQDICQLFYAMEAEGREAYFAAIRAGMERNYHPMQAIFARIIEQSGADV
ncbi:MAG: hypothetical protein ACOYOS_05250 [Syntrophales bacterium]